MHRILHSFALAVALCACRTGASPLAQPPPQVAAPAPAVPVIGVGWTEPDPGPSAMVLAPDGITLGATLLLRLTAGLIDAADVQGGEHAFLVPRLQRAIAERAPPSTSITLAIDPSTPYRTVTRVVYSAGQASVTKVNLAVRVGGAPRVIPIVLATAADLEPVLQRGDPDAPTATLSLMLTVSAGGITVAGTGGQLAPGCERIAAGAGVITVPRATTGHDVATLTSCLQRIHAEFRDETTVTVTADRDVPFADIAPVLAAARGAPGAPLFPRVILGAGIR